jgi:hypothetical protein
MNYWICVIDDGCKMCFSSCNRLKAHQKRLHNCFDEVYRYAHCRIDYRNQETISVRLLQARECIAAYQLRNLSLQEEIVGRNILLQEEIVEKVHRKSMQQPSNFKNQLDRNFQIKQLIRELQLLL